MTFTVTATEHHMLLDILQRHLEDLRSQAARADSRPFKTWLQDREQAVTDLLCRLSVPTLTAVD
jgi:hypothetical protein